MKLYPLPRTAIEAEILFAARVMQVRFLKRLSGKTPREQSSSGKKIGAESAVPILVYLCIVIIVHKYRQSAKRKVFLKRNTVPEVFPLTIGSGKTRPFEKRRSRYKETAENKAEAYRVYVEHLFSACDAVDARIFSKGDGNMTKKSSTTNLPGARGNAYPNAELDYELTYEYDPAYAHRLVHAGNRYYRYDANGNITAEKDGPFTEDDEFVFTYNYDPDTDVYGTDYGFGLDAPKETEESHPENLFAYRRNYTWNEKNLLTKSSDRSYTVHYRYGEDGQRALKYTEEGRSETLYFNNFYTIHIPVQDKNNPQGLRVHKHIFVGNSRLVTAMTHTDNNGDNAEQREKRYYYHSDHLGSAQFVTDWRGRQYEHIEYTPYGELWIEEVAAGLDKLPFRFTGKEMDEETGLYYYGARYLDPKYSRWLSGDPALSDYIPKAPIDDEAKKHNEKLPGMGGVYNTVNLHLYHYAGNNPVKYEDPDGRALETPWDIANGALGLISSVIELSERQYGKAALSFFGAILDFTAACVPGIPGGVSIGIKVFQHGNTAYGAISNIAEGIMEDDQLKVGIGILQMFGMALGEVGSHYFKYAESAFERAKLVPRSMIVGFICSGIRDKHMGTFYKVMSMLGVSADVIKSSYEAYQSWMNNHKKEEIDQ